MQKTFISKSAFSQPTKAIHTPNEKLKTPRKIVVKSPHYTPLTRSFSFLSRSIKKLLNMICCLKMCFAPCINIFKGQSEKNSSPETKILKTKDSRKLKKFVNIIALAMRLKKAIKIFIDKSSFRTPKRLHTQDFAFIDDKTYHQKEKSKPKQSYSVSKKLHFLKHLVPKVWRFSRRLYAKLKIFEGNSFFFFFSNIHCKNRFSEKNVSRSFKENTNNYAR